MSHFLCIFQEQHENGVFTERFDWVFAGFMRWLQKLLRGIVLRCECYCYLYGFEERREATPLLQLL